MYEPDPNIKIPVVLFAHGYPYKFLGFIKTDIHLIGVPEDAGVTAEETIFLLGTDLLGRDLFSRLMIATRVSLSIGLVGVALSLFLGVLLGGISGYYGGAIDTLIQRIIEIIRSIPTIPLWMGLAAALPNDWNVNANLFCHYHHYLTDWLDDPGPGGSRPVLIFARGRFCNCR